MTDRLDRGALAYRRESHHVRAAATRVAAIAMCALVLEGAAWSGSDWPATHGPASNSRRCANELFVDAWQPVWTANCIASTNSSASTLLVKDGRVVVESARIENPPPMASWDHVVTCIDLQTGSTAWTRTITVPHAFLQAGCITGSGATARVFLPFEGGASVLVECRSLLTGDLLGTWTAPSPEATYLHAAQVVPARATPPRPEQVVLSVTGTNPTTVFRTRLVMLDSVTMAESYSADYTDGIAHWSSSVPSVVVGSPPSADVFVLDTPWYPGIGYRVRAIDKVDVSGAAPSAPSTVSTLGLLPYAGLEQLVIAPNGQEAYVVDGVGSLHAINLQTGAEASWSPIAVASGAARVAILENSGLLAVLDSASSIVKAYDVHTGAVSWATALPDALFGRTPTTFGHNFCVLDNDDMLVATTIPPMSPTHLSRTVQLIRPDGALGPSLRVGALGRPAEVIAVDGVFLVRDGAAFLTCYRPCIGPPLACPGSAEVLCAGDGTGAACPCANNGSAGSGCANSLFASGARLSVTGTHHVSIDSERLTATELTGSIAVFYQGASQTNPHVVDDGIACIGSPILRLGASVVVGGTATYPDVGDQAITVRGAIPATGGTRFYQCFYRNAATAFCPPATSNRTNALAVTWVP